MTMTVLNTSDAEWAASEIMAPDLAAMPANNLNADNIRFTRILLTDTFMAIRSFLCCLTGPYTLQI